MTSGDVSSGHTVAGIDRELGTAAGGSAAFGKGRRCSIRGRFQQDVDVETPASWAPVVGDVAVIHNCSEHVLTPVTSSDTLQRGAAYAIVRSGRKIQIPCLVTSSPPRRRIWHHRSEVPVAETGANKTTNPRMPRSSCSCALPILELDVLDCRGASVACPPR